MFLYLQRPEKLYFIRNGKKAYVFIKRSKNDFVYCTTNKSSIRIKNKKIRGDFNRLGLSNRLYFNKFKGTLKYKKTKNGHFIKTTNLGRFFSNKKQDFENRLWINKELLPIKININKGICLKFIEINKEDFSIEVPKEILTVCKEKGITPPPEDDERIKYI